MTDATPAETPDDVPAKAAPVDRSTAGPFDESEANPVRPYIDLGGIKILPREGLNLRLEVEEQTKRIVAVEEIVLALRAEVLETMAATDHKVDSAHARVGELIEELKKPKKGWFT